MKFSVVIFLALSIISNCQTISEIDCECIDHLFSQSGQSPLLVHSIGDIKLIICGYNSDIGDNVIISEEIQDSSFYASGSGNHHVYARKSKMIA